MEAFQSGAAGFGRQKAFEAFEQALGAGQELVEVSHGRGVRVVCSWGCAQGQGDDGEQQGDDAEFEADQPHGASAGWARAGGRWLYSGG